VVYSSEGVWLWFEPHDIAYLADIAAIPTTNITQHHIYLRLASPQPNDSRITNEPSCERKKIVLIKINYEIKVPVITIKHPLTPKIILNKVANMLSTPSKPLSKVEFHQFDVHSAGVGMVTRKDCCVLT
jgi:hypothetical protein